MGGIKSSPGVSNVQIQLRMTRVRTIWVATCLCVVPRRGDSFSEAFRNTESDDLDDNGDGYLDERI